MAGWSPRVSGAITRWTSRGTPRSSAPIAALPNTPQTRLEKRPALRTKQGIWVLYGEMGQVLKRGHELASVLSPVERRLVKLVKE